MKPKRRKRHQHGVAVNRAILRTRSGVIAEPAFGSAFNMGVMV